MACGNNHVTRFPGQIATQGAIDPVIVVAQTNPQHTKPRDDGSGVDRYVDDRGNPRLGNTYPHIHHAGDRRRDEYFVQTSRAPKGLRIAYGATRPGADPYDPHPTQERITFAGRTPPDPALLDMAVDLLGAMLRGEL